MSLALQDTINIVLQKLLLHNEDDIISMEQVLGGRGDTSIIRSY